MLGLWSLCFEFNWWIKLNIRGWLLWLIDGLVDYGRMWWFWVMILFEWWNCVRNQGITVGNLLKFWVSGWRWRKFSLVPQFMPQGPICNISKVQGLNCNFSSSTSDPEFQQITYCYPLISNTNSPFKQNHNSKSSQSSIIN